LASAKQDDLFFQQHRVAADDPWRGAVYNNFQANLADLCRSGRRSGAAVLLVTVPVNLKDSPPFGSLHRADLAEAALLGAGRTNDALRILRELEALQPESEEIKAGISAVQSRGKTQ
jgi:hypothetical protein